MQALFLGAGASYDCGMPIVIELTAELRRWLTPEKLLRFNTGWRTMGIGWSDHTVLFLNSLFLFSQHCPYLTDLLSIAGRTRQRDHTNLQIPTHTSLRASA